MDEAAFLRQQVSTERRHMAEVKNAARAALASSAATQSAAKGELAHFATAAIAYLVFIMERFNAQDQAHCELLRPRVPLSDTDDLAVLDDLEATLSLSRQAIAELASAANPVEGLRAYVAFFDEVLAIRRHVIQHLFEAHYSIDDWRKASFVDADSICEERERYSAVEAALPGGVTLASRARDS